MSDFLLSKAPFHFSPITKLLLTFLNWQQTLLVYQFLRLHQKPSKRDFKCKWAKVYILILRIPGTEIAFSAKVMLLIMDFRILKSWNIKSLVNHFDWNLKKHLFSGQLWAKYSFSKIALHLIGRQLFVLYPFQIFSYCFSPAN